MLDGITIIKEPKDAAPIGTSMSVVKSKDVLGPQARSPLEGHEDIDLKGLSAWLVLNENFARMKPVEGWEGLA